MSIYSKQEYYIDKMTSQSKSTLLLAVHLNFDAFRRSWVSDWLYGRSIPLLTMLFIYSWLNCQNSSGARFQILFALANGHLGFVEPCNNVPNINLASACVGLRNIALTCKSSYCTPISSALSGHQVLIANDVVPTCRTAVWMMLLF